MARPTLRWRAASVVPLAGMVLGLPVGCRDEQDCNVDELLGCTCADGSLGYAACDPVRRRWNVCGSCGLTPGSDASTRSVSDAGSDAAAAPLPLFTACKANEQCASGLCYTYTAKGSFCTHACSGDGECEPPSPQCTPRGVCKLP